MTEIKSPDGTRYDTSEVSQRYEMAFCGECGCRVCWYEIGMHDEPSLVCEDCVARETNGGE